MRVLMASLALVSLVSASPVAGQSAPSQASATATSSPAALEPRQALQRMGAYLGTLQAFEVTSESSLDLITADDQKIDLDGVTTYQVRRPDAFVIENRTDRKVRRFIFDGSRLTVYAPSRGFYASVESPGTIKQVLDTAYDRYGLALPLEDIFHWGDPSNLPGDFQSAEYIGVSTIDGVRTDHYAFRQPDVDWQIWIEQGDRPLPRKVAIIDRTDPTLPAFTARLSWNVAPRFTDQTFAFRPKDGDAPIRFAQQ